MFFCFALYATIDSTNTCYDIEATFVCINYPHNDVSSLSESHHAHMIPTWAG